MEALSSSRLEALKYSELQCLAKSVGLRANFKAAKLLNALKKHFCEEDKNKGIRMSPSTDIGEQNSSQISINLAMITKRHRKQKEDNVQQTTQENLNEEKPVQDSEKEVPILLNCEGSPDSEFGKIRKINQSDDSQSSGAAGNLEDFVTPSQGKERRSPRQKGVESKTLLDSLSGKKATSAGSKSKLGKTRIIATPDFKKLHEAEFNKMLSIDEYVKRKNKLYNFSNSVNESKILAKKNKSLKTSQKENLNTNSKILSSSRGLLLSPSSQKYRFSATGTPIKLRRSIRNSGTANKSILSRKSSFGSTSLSTTKMNVRFSESTKDNEEKRSLIKTPSRKSSFLKIGTPDNPKSSKCTTSKDFKEGAMNCQTTETPTNSAVTPFKFINQTVEPTSTKKPVFDIQASLSRPLTYQPHKGKLKPWVTSSENHQRLHSYKKYKEPPLQTRDERREKHIQGRKQRKDQKLSTLRRLTVL